MEQTAAAYPCLEVPMEDLLVVEVLDGQTELDEPHHDLVLRCRALHRTAPQWSCEMLGFPPTQATKEVAVQLRIDTIKLYSEHPKNTLS